MHQKKYKWAVLLLFVSGLLSGCGTGEEEPLKKQIFAMDTVMDITLYGEGKEEAMNEAADLIGKYERLFSTTREDSDIARINAASGQSVEVQPETFELIQKSLAISEETEGALDISIFPVVRAWGFTTDQFRIPADEEREEALSHVDYKKIRLLSGNRVQIEPGMALDLGAVAKGYLSQKLMERFRERGLTGALVSLGGNVQTWGTKGDGSGFTIGVTDPADGTGIYGSLKVKDRALVTSGIYQRYFEKDGRSYHHIMDGKTGRPVENDIASITVSAADGTTADALATALFVMGERAKDYQAQHRDEIEILIVYKDGSCFCSDGLELER